MPTLDYEITAYDRMRAELERDYPGKWIIMHDGEIAGAFESSEECVQSAVEQFGRGPYLIRQVGAHPMRLPASTALLGDVGVYR